MDNCFLAIMLLDNTIRELFFCCILLMYVSANVLTFHSLSYILPFLISCQISPLFLTSFSTWSYHLTLHHPVCPSPLNLNCNVLGTLCLPFSHSQTIEVTEFQIPFTNSELQLLSKQLPFNTKYKTRIVSKSII